MTIFSHQLNEPSKAFADYLDEQDPLNKMKERFCCPRSKHGTEKIYFCGHSLGLAPKIAKEQLITTFFAWAEHGVEAHFLTPHDWYGFHEKLKPSIARLCGAKNHEVVPMNSLTVNLHLLLATFYRPSKKKHAIAILKTAFSSDHYAIQSHLRSQGQDAEKSMVYIEPDANGLYSLEGIQQTLIQHPEIDVLFIEAVHYLTGQSLPLEGLAKLAQRYQVVLGLDLAHAIGNIPLHLHEWQIDFAVWCSYKYLNGGPGALGGAFIHAKYHDLDLPRLGGWWGNNPETRFASFQAEKFTPVASANGWQLSNPSIFSAAPLLAALSIFDEVNLDHLYAKNQQLSAYLSSVVAVGTLSSVLLGFRSSLSSLGIMLGRAVAFTVGAWIMTSYWHRKSHLIIDQTSLNIEQSKSLYNNISAWLSDCCHLFVRHEPHHAVENRETLAEEGRPLINHESSNYHAYPNTVFARARGYLAA